jgi:hypothetical protein
MNIVKLKDIVMPSEYRMSKFFNENLKGKYAYWVQMRYIFPMNSLDYKTYIQYEQLDAVYMLGPDILPHIDLYSEECCMYDFAQEYIDHDATELANAVSDYCTANDYVADADIDITKLRKFRSWLANEILMFNTGTDGNYLNGLTDNQIHMLEYYKNDMYNEVVKQLGVFGVENAFTMTAQNTGCGCCNTNVATLYGLVTPLTCNGLSIYTKNIHNLMVQTFENVNFWMQFNKDFIRVFKRYIDNIVKTGLGINLTENGLYLQCHCNNANVNATNVLLNNLSEALQYIIDDEVNGHLNFIHDALYNWAEQLYDYMSWSIK